MGKPIVTGNVTTLRAFKADRTGDQWIPELHIVVSDSIPMDSKSRITGEKIAFLRERYEEDAREIALALRGSLPGGTFDLLVAELLKMKACDYRVTL